MKQSQIDNSIKINYRMMLEIIKYESILSIMLSQEEKDAVISDVHSFFKRKHYVSECVLNAVLIRAIQSIKETHGPKAQINEAYLRKTLETFRKEKILNSAQAVMYLERIADVSIKRNKKNKKFTNKDWVQEYFDELVAEQQAFNR